MKLVLGLGSALAIAALAIYLGRGGAEQDELEPTAITTSVAAATPATNEAEPLTPVESPPNQTQVDNREEVHRAGFAGRIEDSRGQPVGGALVSWTPTSVATDGSWQGSDVAAWERASSFTTTNEAGRFSFAERLDDAGRPSALWVTHEEYRAASLQLAPDGPALLEQPIVLEPAEPVQAHVVGLEGDVGGARVLQVGIATDGDPADLRGYLFRVHETGPDGRARLHAFPSEWGLSARKADLRAKPRQGAFEGTVVLRLVESFEASGVVRWEGSPQGDATEHSVAILARRGHIDEHVQTVDAPGGRWGPLDLPAMDVESFVFRATTTGAVPLDEVVPRPSAGDEVFVEHDLTAGHDVWAKVLDQNEDVIFDADVIARWRRPDFRWASTQARPFPEDHDWAGYVLLHGVKASSVVLEARAPGFVRLIAPPLEIPETEPLTNELVLSPAARIRGVVLHSGEPVPNFELCYWEPSVYPPAAWRKTFVDREDGSFEIDDVPVGQVAILASAPDLPRCEAVFFELAADEAAEVTLELPIEKLGRGQVVDASDGSPIPHARIQRYSNHDVRTVAFWGAPVSVEADGSFEVGGMAAGNNVVEAVAEGYGSAWAWAMAGDDGVDFGPIPLERKRTLHVAVHGVPPDALGAYTFDVVGIEELYGLTFDPDGTATVGPIAPSSDYTVKLLRDGITAQQVGSYLRPGSEWQVVFEVGGPQLTVSLRSDGDEAIPKGIAVLGHAVDANGESRVVQQPLEDRAAVLEGLPRGEVLLEARSVEGVVARAVTTLGDESTTATLTLDSKRWSFRLVDASGAPVAGARVFPWLAGFQSDYVSGAVSQDDGVFDLRGLIVGRAVLVAQHPTLGIAPLEVDVTASPGDEPVELVFDPAGAIDLSLRDAAGPVVGATCRLLAFGRHLAIHEATSNEAGQVEWVGLAPAIYSVDIERLGYWPEVAEIELEKGTVASSVTLKRRCQLELLIHNGDGTPAGGVALDLDALGGGSLAEWIESGLVVTDADRMRTSATGRLVVEGLPEGTYTWTARSDAGATASGTLTLVPSSGVIELTVP